MALEPDYASRSTRQFVSGGMAGNLTLHEKGWLGPKDVTLHSGEGPIWSVQWRRNYIVWSNDRGVRIYDTHSASRIGFIPRPEDSPRADLFPCSILWQSDSTLVIAWGDFIKIVTLRSKREQQKEKEEKEAETRSISSRTNPLAGMGALLPGVGDHSSSTQGVTAEVTNVLQLDCMISGIVPFVSKSDDYASPSDSPKDASYSTTSRFIVLSYNTTDTYDDDSTAAGLAQMQAQPPELRIISVSSGEELSSDVLSVNGFERYQCKDYKIVGSFPPTLSESNAKAKRSRNPSATQEQQETYFVISPKNVIMVQKRDVDDHITWLCERQRYEEALKVAEQQGIVNSGAATRGLPRYNVREIGNSFLQHLLDDGNYAKAAESCARILKDDAKGWETWIFTFAQKNQLGVIIPYVPTEKPRLDRMVYEMIMAHYLSVQPSVSGSSAPPTHVCPTLTYLLLSLFAIHACKTLLETIKTWPQDIYDTNAVINLIRGSLDREKASPSADILMECLIELHLMNKQPGKAVPYFLRLRKAGVFDLIKTFNLFPDIQDQALMLVDFEQERKRRRGRPAGEQDSKDTTGHSKHGEAIDLLVEHTHSIPVSRQPDLSSAGFRSQLLLRFSTDISSRPSTAKQSILSVHVPRRPVQSRYTSSDGVQRPASGPLCRVRP